LLLDPRREAKKNQRLKRPIADEGVRKNIRWAGGQIQVGNGANRGRCELNP
jgi:hypothetical protein